MISHDQIWTASLGNVFPSENRQSTVKAFVIPLNACRSEKLGNLTIPLKFLWFVFDGWQCLLRTRADWARKRNAHNRIIFLLADVEIAFFIHR